MGARHIDNLRTIFQKGVSSVQPSALFTQRNIKRINDHTIAINDQQLDLSNKKCHLVGFGKAVLGMAVQMECVLDKNLTSGIISVPCGIIRKFHHNSSMQLKKDTVIKVIEGAKNNLPDENSLEAAKKIYALSNSMSKDDILFVLISGGGSALLPLPMEPFDFESKLNIIKDLSLAGATIEELNTVRIAMSKIKGGQLSMAATNANSIFSFIISDIINNPVDLIASGPTVEFKNNRSDSKAKNVLEKYHMWEKMPNERKLIFQKPSGEKYKNIFPKNNFVFIVGSNEIAVKACLAEGTQLFYRPLVLSTSVRGNVEDVCSNYKELLQNIYRYKLKLLKRDEFESQFRFDHEILSQLCDAIESENQNPLLLIFGGEPSVNVIGSGLGGRSQELALRMSLECKKIQLLQRVVVLCAGTDGIDGPTTAAGAIGCADVIDDYLKTKRNPIEDYILSNDSYNFYDQLMEGFYHINIGHTGTNVMDLHLIVVD